MRVFGKRVVPNLVLLARQQERVALRNPNYGWLARRQSHRTVSLFGQPKKWLARAPATAPGAGTLPFQ